MLNSEREREREREIAVKNNKVLINWICILTAETMAGSTGGSSSLLPI